MSVRSPVQQWIRRPTTTHDASKPLSAAYGQALACNAIHAADSSGQVIACWKLPASDSLTHDAKSGTSLTWIKVWESLPYIPTLQPDGTPFEMRIGLAGRATSASGCKFRLVVSPLGSGASMSSTTAEASTSEYTAANATDAWQTGTYSVLKPSRRFALASVGGITVASELSGVAFEGIRVPQWSVSVWFDTGSVADGELSGVYAAEWVGK